MLTKFCHRLRSSLRLLFADDTKQSELYFMLFEKMADPMLLIKGDQFIHCNEAVIKLLAYPNKESFLNQRPWDISPEYQADGMSSFEKSNA